jgi:Family of unknown function (DUF6703)
VDNRRLAGLRRLRPIWVFLIALAVAAVAYLTPGVIGTVLLVAIAAGMGWLLVQTWPVTPGPMRILRLLVLLGLLMMALFKIY